MLKEPCPAANQQRKKRLPIFSPPLQAAKLVFLSITPFSKPSVPITGLKTEPGG